MSERIAVLVENDFHDIEFWYPYYRLQESGHEPIIVAPTATHYCPDRKSVV